MAVVEVEAPTGAVTLSAPSELRQQVEAAQVRYSSPDAEPAVVRSDETAKLATQIGSTERALRTAQGMIQRHLSTAGHGQAGPVTAEVLGLRNMKLTSPGLMVSSRHTALDVGVALLADPLVVLMRGGAERVLHWSLLPGGPSVTARADALRFLRALAAGGALVLCMGKADPLPPLEFDGGAWDDDDEWRLFEDLATLEEWSGVSLPVPEVVTAEEATQAAQAASWARTQQIAASITDAIEFSVSNGHGVDEADELRLHQDFGLSLFGEELPLGQGTARIPISRVEPTGANGGPAYRAWPAQSEITLWLAPPPTRRVPARRTQSPELAPPLAPDRVQRSPGTTGLDSTAIARPARRRISEVVRARRGRHAPRPRHKRGTAGLLDDIRGD